MKPPETQHAEDKVRILLLEDNPYDAELIHNQISKGNIKYQFRHVSELDDFAKAIDEYSPDLILSDYNLVGFTGLDALVLVRQKCALTPFIIVTGTLNEEIAAETIMKGAWDYVVKERLARLNTAIKNVLHLKEEKDKRAIAKEELKASEERAMLAIDGSQDGIWDRNFVSDETYFSSRWKSMLGYEDHELKNHYTTWEALIHPEDKEYTLAALNKHLKNEIPFYKVESRLKCKDGNYKWISARGKAMFDQNGNPYRIAGSHTDISERKLMEINLIKAKERAEESDRLKTAFLHNISHEIRTPMNGICGFVDLLGKPNLSLDKKGKFISLIKKCSTQLLSIINDLLDISIIDAGQISINSNSVSVHKLLLDSISVHKPLADKKKIQILLKERLSENEDLMITDQTKLQQILNNLIKNAIKFTPKGQINLGVYLNNNDIIFYVEDTGIGITPEFQERIFERFYQEEREDGHFNEGTGLGLSISRALIEKMGGKLWLKSEPGAGSTFSFSHPYKPVNAIVHTIRNDSEQIINWSGKTILIAEDDQLAYLFFSEILKDTGINILHAINGKEAIDLCHKKPEIDLVLMDIKMPEVGGYDAIKAIKKVRPTLAIIAQTAYAMSGDKQKTMDAGADDYITKPVKIETLINKINEVFAQKIQISQAEN